MYGVVLDARVGRENGRPPPPVWCTRQLLACLADACVALMGYIPPTGGKKTQVYIPLHGIFREVSGGTVGLVETEDHRGKTVALFARR